MREQTTFSWMTADEADRFVPCAGSGSAPGRAVSGPDATAACPVCAVEVPVRRGVFMEHGVRP